MGPGRFKRAGQGLQMSVDFSQQAGPSRQTRDDFSNGPGWAGKREINFITYWTKKNKHHQKIYLLCAIN